MKYGVPVFSYQNFPNFEKSLEANGFYTVNLGDNMQSIAVRHVYRQLGVPDDEIISIDRDTLPKYDGEPAYLVMNGVFSRWSFPLPRQITPIFVGFTTNEKTIIDFRATFVRSQPIGCRDLHTHALFVKHGIDAYVSGCVTLALPEREAARPDSVFLVYGAGAGEFPAAILKHMPDDLLDRAQFVSQRLAVDQYPLPIAERARIERYAESLLDTYRSRAALVITPLHHAATPCMALGIPVVVGRLSTDPRFSFLQQITRVYGPDDFAEIDFSPPAVPLGHIRSKLVQEIGLRIA